MKAAGNNSLPQSTADLRPLSLHWQDSRLQGLKMTDIQSELIKLSTCHLSDALGGKGVLEPGLIRLSGIGTAAGRVVTAECSKGSLQPVFVALEAAQPTDFLCIRGPGNTAYLGDMLATNVVNRGLSGVIVDGLARDRSALAAMSATFCAKGITPVNLRRQEPGKAMEPILFCGVEIEPGDWLVVDDDGAIAIKPSEVEDAVQRANKAVRLEVRIRELILQRMPVPEAVRRAMAEAGA